MDLVGQLHTQPVVTAESFWEKKIYFSLVMAKYLYKLLSLLFLIGGGKGLSLSLTHPPHPASPSLP